MTAIETEGLTKRFGDVTAVRDLDLSVADGDVYGLIGPNGSGKSTVFKLLLDFVRPSSGRASVFGHDVHDERLAVRRRIGVVPEGYASYERLTGREHVEFVASARGVEADPEAILRRVGLADDGDRRSSGYSAGMRKRLLIGMALVGDPDLLLLDEPFSGLDPRAVSTLREIVDAENDRGTTVFFSSHLFREVEATCDRVALLLDGERVAEGTVGDLRRRVASDTLQFSVEDADAAVDVLRDRDDVVEVTVEPETVTAVCDPGRKAAVVAALFEAGVTIRDFETVGDPLEDVFLAATEDTGGDADAAAGVERPRENDATAADVGGDGR